jgi:hypothetical protein
MCIYTTDIYIHVYIIIYINTYIYIWLNYIYTLYIYIHTIYIYGLCQKRNKWTIARWGYLRESTHSHASIHEGRNSLRLCLCPRQGKYRQRPLWFLAVFTSFDLIILCKLMINLINHGLWDSHGYLMAGLSKSGMCNPPSELFSGFPSAQAMPGPLHILREDSLCHPRHVELWKMRVQRTSCATGQRAGSWRIIRAPISRWIIMIEYMEGWP